MASLNMVQLIGNLGKDPELRTTPNGRQVCSFSMAMNEKWKDAQTGEAKERTEWANIVCWGKVAELCAQYLAKGRPVYVEGKLSTRSYDAQDGTKKWVTEIIAKNVLFLNAGTPGNRGEQRPAAAPGAQDMPFEDDIPF